MVMVIRRRCKLFDATDGSIGDFAVGQHPHIHMVRGKLGKKVKAKKVKESK